MTIRLSPVSVNFPARQLVLTGAGTTAVAGPCDVTAAGRGDAVVAVAEAGGRTARDVMAVAVHSTARRRARTLLMLASRWSCRTELTLVAAALPADENGAHRAM